MKIELTYAQAAEAANSNPFDIGVRVFGRYHVFSEKTSRGPIAWLAESQRDFYILQRVVGRLVLQSPTHYYGYRVVDGEVIHQFGKGEGEEFDPQFLGFLDGHYIYLTESGEYSVIRRLPPGLFE